MNRISLIVTLSVACAIIGVASANKHPRHHPGHHFDNEVGEFEIEPTGYGQFRSPYSHLEEDSPCHQCFAHEHGYVHGGHGGHGGQGGFEHGLGGGHHHGVHGGKQGIKHPKFGGYEKGGFGKGGFGKGGFGKGGFGKGDVGHKAGFDKGFNNFGKPKFGGSGFGKHGGHAGFGHPSVHLGGKEGFEGAKGGALGAGKFLEGAHHESSHNDDEGSHKHNVFNNDKTIISDRTSGFSDVDGFRHSTGNSESDSIKGGAGFLGAAGSGFRGEKEAEFDIE